MYLKQWNGTCNTYAYVIGFHKNGGKKVIAISEDRPIPSIDSTKFWYPQPVEIDPREVDDRLFQKIKKHALKKGYPIPIK